MKIPRKNILACEAWVFENSSVLASIKRGLQQSATGKTRHLGSFAKHASKRTMDRMTIVAITPHP